MTKKDLSFDEKVEFIANFIGDNFLRFARALRELQDEQPDILLKVAELAGLCNRKSYALARISRQFDDLGASEERLYSIGWTKLQIIGRYLTEDNGEYLLQLAELNTAHDLEALLRGETPVEDAKVVQFYLSANDYKRLRSKLVTHGAVVSGNGLAKKELALMKLLSHSD